MNAWDRFNDPATGYGLAAALMFWVLVAAVALAVGEIEGGGWQMRFAWLLAGCILIYQWWLIADFLKDQEVQD